MSCSTDQSIISKHDPSTGWMDWQVKNPFYFFLEPFFWKKLYLISLFLFFTLVKLFLEWLQGARWFVETKLMLYSYFISSTNRTYILWWEMFFYNSPYITLKGCINQFIILNTLFFSFPLNYSFVYQLGFSIFFSRIFELASANFLVALSTGGLFKEFVKLERPV